MCGSDVRRWVNKELFLKLVLIFLHLRMTFIPGCCADLRRWRSGSWWWMPGSLWSGSGSGPLPESRSAPRCTSGWSRSPGSSDSDAECWAPSPGSSSAPPSGWTPDFSWTFWSSFQEPCWGGFWSSGVLILPVWVTESVSSNPAQKRKKLKTRHQLRVI